MNKLYKILAVLCLIGIAYGIGKGVGMCKQYKENQTLKPETKRTEKVVYDTIREIQEKNSVVYRHDTILLPVFVNDTAESDTLPAEIPISRYVFDTLGGTLWVSGFNVSLDSMSLKTKIITDSIYIEKKPKWHWGCGIALGVGYVK